MSDRPRLRDWDAVHIDEHIPLLTGEHQNELFYNCTIDALRDVTLLNCCLTKSRILSSSLHDMQNVTATLDCHHFHDVEFSESAFDYLLMLLIKTKGNTEKRARLIEVIGKDNLLNLLAQTRL